MTEIRYRPGRWFGIVSEHGIALLPDVLDEDAVKQVWSSFAEGRGLAGVLETLTSAFGVGLMSLPPFAVVALEGELVRVAVRGDLLVTVTESLDETDPPSVLSGEGVTTWSERMIASPVAVSVRQKASRRGSALSLPISSGVVLCSQLTSTFRGATVEAGPGSVEAPVEEESDTEAIDSEPEIEPEIEPEATGLAIAPEPTAPPADPAPVDSAPVDSAPVSAPVSALADTAAPSAVPLGGGAENDLDEWGYPRSSTDTPVPPVAESAPAADPEASVRPEVTAPPEATFPPAAPAPLAPPVLPDAGVPDAALPPEATRAPESTMAREQTRVPSETVRPAEEEYDHLFGATVARVVEDAAVRVAEPDEAAVIGGVPSFAVDNAPSAVAPAGTDGDHDGHTISIAELRALQAAAPPAPPVPERRPTPTARLELSTGDVIELDRPVVIGRRPATGRASAHELPQLVTVPSPMQDISRSHLDVRAEGIHVVVRDLATVNGTVLRRAGQVPVRLNASEPVVVVGGDVLDLGDGVTVTVREFV